MLDRIRMFFQGYLFIKMYTVNPERFINICKSKGIGLKEVVFSKDECSFYALKKNLELINEAALKTNTTINVINEYGLQVHIKKHMGHKMFFAGIIIAYLIIHQLSLYVWNIGFEGNFTYTEQVLLEYLKSIDVSCGKRINTIDCDEIETMIRNTFKDITWVSVEVKGTKMFVSIKENTYRQTFVNEQEVCDIVADKDGIITNMVTRKGVAMVKVGDTVKTGDILVSGTIDLYDDYGEVTGKKYVHADASITISKTYEINEELKADYNGKIYTGNEKEKYYFSVKDKIIFQAGKCDFEYYDTFTEDKQLKLTDTLYMPLSMGKVVYKEYEKVEARYDLEKAKAILEERINEYFKNLEQLGVVIIEKNVKIDVYNNSYIAIGYIDVKEPIGEDVIIEKVTEDILLE